MSINLESIDLLRERANVSYEEAREALERCNGDLVEALIYLEKTQKIRAEKKECKGTFWTKVKKIIKKGNETKFIVKKNGENILKIPMTITVILAIAATPFFFLGLLIAILTNHKIRIEKETGEDLEINKVIEKVSNTVTTAADKVAEEIKKA